VRERKIAKIGHFMQSTRPIAPVPSANRYPKNPVSTSRSCGIELDQVGASQWAYRTWAFAPIKMAVWLHTRDIGKNANVIIQLRC
jgi:hypothetical protein